MARTPTWKVVTVGAALTGLGVVGAGTAATAAAAPVPTISAQHADWAFADDSPDVSFLAMDDSWDDSPWEDSPFDD